ncbi:MAG: type II toxin-antitoxin system RelE/ParE family toxin [Leptolyngbyaceae bacterium]|nr:type II toxin-antitoxin system RelE/ParE family toxin [Leptolyngbyaceae bacterium]
MSQWSPTVDVQFSPEFQNNLKALRKRYRHIRSDIQPVIDQLEIGETPGDKISGTNYTVFKVRVKNSDIQKGKSGGYRIIYTLKTALEILLVTVYSKSDQGDIDTLIINQIIREFEAG